MLPQPDAKTTQAGFSLNRAVAKSSFPSMKSLRNVWSIAREAAVAWRIGDGLRSKLRLAADVLLSRGLKLGHLPGFNKMRTVQIVGGTSLSYRLNRGDLQGIREVWMDRVYRLPFTMVPRIVVDLGANIGLSSVWLQKQFACEQIIAVEPNAANAQLTKRNFELNGIRGRVVEAAIGPEEGEAQFQSFDESNMGRITAGGLPSTNAVTVAMTSMEAVLKLLPEGRRIDLVKMDIEGGEALLFARNTEWLDRVDAIVTELHPDAVDCAPLLAVLAAAGFTFIPCNSVFPRSPTAFIRNTHPAAAPILSAVA